MDSPYQDWLKSQTDYRAPITQNEDYTRDRLNRSDFAVESNRVNLEGDYYYSRRSVAEAADLIPHYYGNMDRFGWEDWLRAREQEKSNLAPKLNEENDRTVGGTYLQTTNKVQHRSCRTCSRPRKYI